jgi:hypothetical protein
MRWLLTPTLAFIWLIGAGSTVSAGEHPRGPEIFFIPNANAFTPDFPNLWSDDAPWQTAAKKVDVLGILHSWVLQASDAQILAVTEFAKRHHMKLDMDVEAVLRGPAPACGQMEGYIWASAFPQALATLKRLNIQLDTMSMDGPLYNGHYITAANGGCALSVRDLTANVASTLAPVLAQYPAIQLYEIEPSPMLTTFVDWRESLNNFDDGLARALGTPVRGLFLDTTWDSPSWIQPLMDFRAYTQERNMSLGWYFDSASYVYSDAEWLNSAATNIEYIEGTLGITPDIGLIASWNQYPAYNMPDTWPMGLTSLINHYFRTRMRLDVQFVGQGAHGRLTTLYDNKPMAGATVSGYMQGVDFSQPLPVNVIQGVVPPNADFAVIGYRMNMECNCQGNNDILIGTMNFQETQGGSTNYSYLLPDFDQTFSGPPYNGAFVTNEIVGGTRVNRIITTPSQAFGTNSAWIPVTPGAQYTYTVPSATVGSGPWYGHIFLLWFDQTQSVVLGSTTAVPAPGEILESSAVTSSDGSFTLPKLPRVGQGSAPVTVEYTGDATHRPVTWSAQ